MDAKEVVGKENEVPGSPVAAKATVKVDGATTAGKTAAESGGETKVRMRARVTEFGYPPVHDALILGVKAPQGTEAFKKGLGLLVSTPFEQLSIKDDIIGSVLVRSSVLRRISPERLVDFVMRRVKPLMGIEEILHVDMSIEVELDDESP
jgi:hypothetical protein